MNRVKEFQSWLDKQKVGVFDFTSMLDVGEYELWTLGYVKQWLWEKKGYYIYVFHDNVAASKSGTPFMACLNEVGTDFEDCASGYVKSPLEAEILVIKKYFESE